MIYHIGRFALQDLIGPVARATAALSRLDERLAQSPVREGWIERSHFQDAAAALWLLGELVHLEDLVLHDAHMDIRAPTHELTRAHAVLRARRQILAQPADWALSQPGLRHLTGRGVPTTQNKGEGRAEPESDALTERLPDESLTAAFAAIDAVLERTAGLLNGADVPVRVPALPTPDRPSLVYDLDWNEEARLDEWQDVLAQTRDLPPVLRAALLLDAWAEIEVLQHAVWLGPLLIAALLRQEGLATAHLPCLHLGAQKIPRERRRARDRNERLLAFLEAIHQMALTGLAEHDRLTLAKRQMERRLRDRRASSKLPQVIELVLARPLVSTPMIQERLKVSKQGALNLIGELNLREMTGRGRFRAWGIL